MTRLSGQRSSLRNDIDTILSYYLPHPNKSVICVDSDVGHDTNGQGSVKKPFKTLTHAESVAAIRDTILGYGTTPFIEELVLDVVGLRVLGLGNGLSEIRGHDVATPNIDIDAHGIELAGFIIDGTGRSNHGIRVINSDNFYIHHNLIRNIGGGLVNDCIDKSSGAFSNDGRIEYNTIRDNTGGYGMALASVNRCKIIGNHIYNMGLHGIKNMACDNHEILENYIFNCNVGIWMGGGSDNNRIADNTVVASVVRDLEDEGTGNRWLDNKFQQLLSGTHTTVGVVEETIFEDRCVQPLTRISGYLRLNNLVAGDDFILRVLKSHDAGVNWDIIDETQLVGAQLIDRYNYDVTLEDADEQMCVTVDRQSGIDRSFYHKRTISNA